MHTKKLKMGARDASEDCFSGIRTKKGARNASEDCISGIRTKKCVTVMLF